jgi:hypothetical protein
LNGAHVQCLFRITRHSGMRLSLPQCVTFYLFQVYIYIHTKTSSSARLLSIERRRMSGRLSIASLRFILIEYIYKKKEERKKKDSKIFDLYTDSRRKRKEEKVFNVFFFLLLLPIRPLEKVVATVQCWMNRRREWRSVITGEWMK